jgi:ketosteroid isomerase-like protein
VAEQDDEIQVRALMREILRAFREHDVAALDRVFADEFTFSDPSGPVISKQQWLADIASGNLVFDSIEAGDVEFRHLGDRAIVLGQALIKARYTKGDYNGTFRYIGVYTRQDGGWKLELTSADRGESAKS